MALKEPLLEPELLTFIRPVFTTEYYFSRRPENVPEVTGGNCSKAAAFSSWKADAIYRPEPSRAGGGWWHPCLVPVGIPA